MFQMYSQGYESFSVPRSRNNEENAKIKLDRQQAQNGHFDDLAQK
jgi:hypothetical protein